ncbi:MAG TPA: AAA family ATPase [Elusimicrobiota bacterium]|nr:AAA family ATPase [Elusimicrobiota bacterium]
MTDIRLVSEKVKQESQFVEEVFAELGRVIVGQRTLLERLLVGLLGHGHLLLEGVPGLAKTLAVRTLAAILEAQFQRIQFTPDLLPADVIGTLIYNPKEGSFSVKKGPVFTNLLLADEINRAPAKVQSALLEAMQERQVTIGDTTHALPEPFLVLATQNPIEQEGTYPLPEAQVDRFMLKIKVSYPSREEEKTVMERMSLPEAPRARRVVSLDRIAQARRVVDEIYVDEKIKNYILDIVAATRRPEGTALAPLKNLIQFGASPRATLALHKAAQALAFLKGRGYVTPEDVKSIGPDVLRHRVILTYEAEAEEKTVEDVLQHIFNEVDVP